MLLIVANIREALGLFLVFKFEMYIYVGGVCVEKWRKSNLSCFSLVIGLVRGWKMI